MSWYCVGRPRLRSITVRWLFICFTSKKSSLEEDILTNGPAKESSRTRYGCLLNNTRQLTASVWEVRLRKNKLKVLLMLLNNNKKYITSG